MKPHKDTEIIFEICEDEFDGGYAARALGYSIFTEGWTVKEVTKNVLEAIDCFFDETMERPCTVRLHFVREEVLAL